MNPVATRGDFLALTAEQQAKFTAVLDTLETQRLPCRCERSGSDFLIVVGPGLSSARYWKDRFGI